MSTDQTRLAVRPVTGRSAGIALLLASGVCFSTAGVFIRMIEQADAWQVVFHRSLTFSLAVLFYVVVRRRRQTVEAFVSMGPAGLIGAAGLGFGAVFLVWAQFHTTIANTVFILGGLPFLTGLLAWAVLGEKLSSSSWATMALALVGISIMVYSGIVAGDLFGNLLALVAIVGYAVFTLAVRRGRGGDTTPILVLGAAFAVLAAFVVHPSVTVTPIDFMWSALMGGGSMAVGFIMFARGAKAVRAGEMWLLSNIEILTGPLLVWFVIAEVPTTETFIGGALIVAAIVVQAAFAARSEPAGE
ncbi:MAG: hypothetical protein EXQ91_00125 [Alphaproteobacteria bacterium]|nr:hypothetical protein [Alphaproteobacteria bacterium]